MKIDEIKTALHDAEIQYEHIPFFYPRHDCRVWTLRIDPEGKNMFLTCCVNRSELDEVKYDILESTGTAYGIDEDSILERIFQSIN